MNFILIDDKLIRVEHVCYTTPNQMGLDICFTNGEKLYLSAAEKKLFWEKIHAMVKHMAEVAE